MTLTAVVVSVFAGLAGAGIGTAAGFLVGTYFGAELWRSAGKDATEQINSAISFEPCGEHDDDDEDRDPADEWKRGKK